MTQTLPAKHDVTQGVLEMRRGEGFVITTDITNLSSTTPSSIVDTIIRASDNTDVTTDFLAVNSPSASGTVITHSEIMPPADAALGTYILNVQFEADGFSPAKRIVYIEVYE